MPAKTKAVKRGKTKAAERPPVKVADLAALRALDAFSLDEGQRLTVGSTGDLYVLHAATETPDNLTVITASCKPGYQLHRRSARTEAERRTQLAALEARAALKADALKLVEQLALYWVEEGTRGDEPGSAKEAFELLIKHEYAFVATAPAKLLRPDGSEVTR